MKRVIPVVLICVFSSALAWAVPSHAKIVRVKANHHHAQHHHAHKATKHHAPKHHHHAV
jgi:hypothetical protein